MKKSANIYANRCILYWLASRLATLVAQQRTFISAGKYEFIRFFPVAERRDQVRVKIMLFLQGDVKVYRNRDALRYAIAATVAGRITSDRAGRRRRWRMRTRNPGRVRYQARFNRNRLKSQPSWTLVWRGDITKEEGEGGAAGEEGERGQKGPKFDE